MKFKKMNFHTFDMKMENNNMELNKMFFNTGWKSIYNTNFLGNKIIKQKNKEENEVRKINVLFRTGTGVNVNVIIDADKTMSDLISLFLKKVGKPEFFGKEEDVYFIYNGAKFDHRNEKPLSRAFSSLQPTIFVNETRNLIGA